MKKLNLITNFSARTYQQSLFANSMDKNSLVVLPTGLGKTIVALMLATYYFNKNNKKILFLAPTKPLVEQQQFSFQEFYKNKEDFKFVTLTGLVAPKKRQAIYEESDFIFSTPQLIENDIINGVINPKDFGLVIFDEAHRGTGNYAYCFIAQEFEKSANTKFLALTASPGTSKEDIFNVIDNLKIESVQVKTYQDSDVKPYVNKTEIEHIKVKIDQSFRAVLGHLNAVFLELLHILQQIKILIGKTPQNISKRDLLSLSAELRELISSGETTEDTWKAVSVAAAIMKLQHGIELFESQEVSAAYTYFYNMVRPGGDGSKAAEMIIKDFDFNKAFNMIKELKKQGILHPKLIELKKQVTKEVLKNPDLKIIIFSQYRDSATKIVEELKTIKNINPAVFVGQSKKGNLKMSQKDQKKVLEDFREGKYNILVSTSVGEEGLDIPKVDLVIFYEPVPSAIRTIQRIGRTGRFKKGHAKIMQTEGTRDVTIHHIANAKERKMYKVLSEIKDQFENKKTESTLDIFLNKTTEEQKEFMEELKSKITIEEPPKKDEKTLFEITNDEDDQRIPIYVDQRENTKLIKELFQLDDIKVIGKQLEIGDIVISEKIAIERKEKLDFVNSIIDKRLFSQLIDLAKNYKRPVLIIEGSQNIYTLRNINPNVIRATLSSIAIDLRIPIIYTDSIAETALMIQTIAKRNVRTKKNISLADNKRSFSENEEIEKFVSSIPKINVVNAKGLLSAFSTIKNLVNSKEEHLIKIDGIGKGRAKHLFDFFNKEYK
jgi:ERCC4-related helicase/ERCC4-type nuclease